MVVPVVPVARMHWQSAGLTDRGRKRRRNEDALLVDAMRGLFAVADGMGGHADGHVASRLAIEALSGAFPRAPSPRIGAASLSRRLLAAFEEANRSILAHASREARAAGMGTTLTVLMPLRSAPACVIAHIGDSRAYRFRGGELTQLTRDHTWVQQQVDGGILTPHQARHHPMSNVLSRVLGTPQIGPPDTFVADVADGDLFLLCSDGLTNMLPPDTLVALLRTPGEPADHVNGLIAAANANGGRDNITCIVLKAEAA